ncbi:hypothetical protein YW5DRAFT_03034 [Streptomyces sp. Ncost-T6T-1]|uniref:hypothetical protein n=1 Tax=Streptomyces sp. Ncost-T6T-1 TaxID=1100828 RepID=UPI000804D6A4|nr:hypothetical protein [Streptomyces sp. Ncost-T6T-1]SBV05636.1 hypothetical protein YW5DRAFT_03034 [Streptomyces sp. Ncost-T6T-1]
MSSSQQDANGPEALPWARQSAVAEEPTTARLRRIVEGLPDWEPLPPGEIVVRRGGNG